MPSNLQTLALLLKDNPNNKSIGDAFLKVLTAQNSADPTAASILSQAGGSSQSAVNPYLEGFTEYQSPQTTTPTGVSSKGSVGTQQKNPADNPVNDVLGIGGLIHGVAKTAGGISGGLTSLVGDASAAIDKGLNAVGSIGGIVTGKTEQSNKWAQSVGFKDYNDLLTNARIQKDSKGQSYFTTPSGSIVDLNPTQLDQLAGDAQNPFTTSGKDQTFTNPLEEAAKGFNEQGRTSLKDQLFSGNYGDLNGVRDVSGGALDLGSQFITDPTSYIPVGAVGKGIGKGLSKVPGLGGIAGKITNAATKEDGIAKAVSTAADTGDNTVANYVSGITKAEGTHSANALFKNNPAMVSTFTQAEQPLVTAGAQIMKDLKYPVENMGKTVDKIDHSIDTLDGVSKAFAKQAGEVPLDINAVRNAAETALLGTGQADTNQIVKKILDIATKNVGDSHIIDAVKLTDNIDALKALSRGSNPIVAKAINNATDQLRNMLGDKFDSLGNIPGLNTVAHDLLMSDPHLARLSPLLKGGTSYSELRGVMKPLITAREMAQNVVKAKRSSKGFLNGLDLTRPFKAIPESPIFGTALRGATNGLGGALDTLKGQNAKSRGLGAAENILNKSGMADKLGRGIGGIGNLGLGDKRLKNLPLSLAGVLGGSLNDGSSPDQQDSFQSNTSSGGLGGQADQIVQSINERKSTSKEVYNTLIAGGLSASDAKSYIDVNYPKFTASQDKELRGSQNALKVLDQIESSFNASGGGQGLAGYFGKINIGGVGPDSKAIAYDTTLKGNVPQFRQAAGESGAFTDKDQEKIESLLPQRTDSAEVAKTKIESLRRMLLGHLEVVANSAGQ